MADYAVRLAPAAERQFEKLPARARELVAAAMVALGMNPRPPGCLKLSGVNDLWSIRVRAYRVIYTIADATLTVTVVKVADRKDAHG